jgi:hypothetical protein
MARLFGTDVGRGIANETLTCELAFNWAGGRFRAGKQRTPTHAARGA